MKEGGKQILHLYTNITLRGLKKAFDVPSNKKGLYSGLLYINIEYKGPRCLQGKYY